MEEKGKRLKTDDDDDGDQITKLPEALIQHIQSFLTEKEAVRSTILSKSWYAAWLTGPTLDFDQSRRRRCRFRINFAEFVSSKMQRYESLNLKIDRFRLRTISNTKKCGTDLHANKLTVKAVKMGATDLNLDFRPANLLLPIEVLESETLLRLSVTGRKIDDGKVKCWRLKSLTLDRVVMRSDDVFRDIVSRCVLIEELSLSHCRSMSPSGKGNGKMLSLGSAMNYLYQLHKLRRLVLEFVNVGTLFLTEFGSRFPWLKELSVDRCSGFKSVVIASTSLERIRFLKVKGVLTAEIEAPNLVKFSYSGQSIPSSLCIKSSKEWKSGISITKSTIRDGVTGLWFQRMKKLLTQLSLSPNSKISLSIDVKKYYNNVQAAVPVSEPPPPLALMEKLTIAVPVNDSGMALVLDVFRICRPKMIVTDSWWGNKELRDFVSTRLMKDMISPDCGIPDQDMFGEFGLNLVKFEKKYYQESVEEWRQRNPMLTQPPPSFYKLWIKPTTILLQLTWVGMNRYG